LKIRNQKLNIGAKSIQLFLTTTWLWLPTKRFIYNDDSLIQEKSKTPRVTRVWSHANRLGQLEVEYFQRVLESIIGRVRQCQVSLCSRPPPSSPGDFGAKSWTKGLHSFINHKSPFDKVTTPKIDTKKISIWAFEHGSYCWVFLKVKKRFHIFFERIHFGILSMK